MIHITIVLSIILCCLLAIKEDSATFVVYTRYKKRRDFLLKKIKTGSVLRGTCSSTGEIFIISRSGITKEKKPLL